MAQERKSSLRSEGGRKLLDFAYNLNIEDPGNHLAETQSFLKKNNGSLIMYGNHIAYDDPLLAGMLYLRYFNQTYDRHLVVPASHWHMNPKNNMLFYQGGKLVEKLFNAELFKLIQNYMVNNEKFPGYTTEIAEANHRVFFRRLRELKSFNIPTDILIYPEGHRSEDGVIQKVEKGMILAGSTLKPSVFLPIGISYKNDNYVRNILNTRLLFKKPILHIGIPTFMRESKERPEIELLVHNLVECLPSWMRGTMNQPRQATL